MEETLRLVQEDVESRDLVKILQKKLKYVGGKLEMIVQRKRNKTGLINGLGSVIKAITGNLDAEEQDIRKIKEEEERVRHNVRVPGTLNNKFIVML